MRTGDFDYELPEELVAQHPASVRDASRLLVFQRANGKIEHRKFSELVLYLRPNDVLVLNNSRVIPARLRGRNAKTGGQFEILLLEEVATNDWWVLLRPGKRARVGTEIIFQQLIQTQIDLRATIVETNDEGHRRLNFFGVKNILDALETFGEIPLPPYINRDSPNQLPEDRARYQTVFAENAGSVAAPTAGLHFTDSLLDTIRSRGVSVCFVTLHVGLGTFAPVKADTLSSHIMHEERFHISDETAQIINEAKQAGHRIIAVGTTTVRVLESVATTTPSLYPGSGKTRIFIYPPYHFKIVDALVTNFHLPRSTLLMLVSAFAEPSGTHGREKILDAYAKAIRERYRFFSYGDAMLLL